MELLEPPRLFGNVLGVLDAVWDGSPGGCQWRRKPAVLDKIPGRQPHPYVVFERVALDIFSTLLWSFLNYLFKILEAFLVLWMRCWTVFSVVVSSADGGFFPDKYQGASLPRMVIF